MKCIAQMLCMYVVIAVSSACQQVNAAAVRTVALTGQHAPGTPDGVSFNGFRVGTASNRPFAPVINDAGQVAFVGSLTGGDVDATNNQGIWSEGSGDLGLVARKGSQAPGAPDGAVFNRFGFSLGNAYLLFNDVGQTAFSASFIGSADGGGIWSEGSGSLGLVARHGDPAPGAPDGATLVLLSPFGVDGLVLNNNGQTTFSDRWTTGASGGWGIWSDRSGSLRKVAISGDPVPRLASGVTFSYSGRPVPAMNNADQIAFSSGIDGHEVTTSNNVAMWSEGSGSLSLVARKSEQAPGLPSGVVFSTFNRPIINNAGHIAFVAGISSGRSIWSNASGSLKSIVVEGQPVLGLPAGEFLTSLSIWQFPLFNNAGHTAFRARIVDGTPIESAGIFLERDGIVDVVARAGDRAPDTPDGVTFAGSFGSYNTFTMPFLNDADQMAFRAGLAGTGVDATNDQAIWASHRGGAVHLIARTGDLLEVAPGDFRTISTLDLDFADSQYQPRPNASTVFNNLGQLAFLAAFTDGTSGIFVSNAVAVPEPSTIAMFLLGSLFTIRVRLFTTNNNNYGLRTINGLHLIRKTAARESCQQS